MGGISSLVSILTILGFIVAAGGVALIVAAVSQNRSARGGIGLTILGVIFGVVFLFIGSGLLEVGATQVAVAYNMLTGQLETPKRSGIHIIAPGVYQITMYPTNQQDYIMSGASSEGAREGNDAVAARSIDGQEVTMDITILYRINPDSVNQIHLDWSGVEGGYSEGLIRPQTRSVVRDVISNFQAEQIYGGGHDEIQSQIEEQLGERLTERGFVLNDVLVRNITFSAQFTDAIERKQIEEQELERAQTAAERARTDAKGEADAAIESARGEAEAILVRAAANAEALRLVSEQIAANPNLLQYVYIQTLADNINMAIIPSNSPFLFDSNTFTDLGEGFTAPAVPQNLIPDTDEEGTGE